MPGLISCDEFIPENLSLCFPPHGLSNLQPHHSLPLHCTMCSKLPCHARLPRGFPPNISKASPRVPQGMKFGSFQTFRSTSVQNMLTCRPSRRCSLSPSQCLILYPAVKLQ